MGETGAMGTLALSGGIGLGSAAAGMRGNVGEALGAAKELLSSGPSACAHSAR